LTTEFLSKSTIRPYIDSMSEITTETPVTLSASAAKQINAIMTKIAQVSQFLNQFAPTRLAEEWDNVGLLVGDPKLVVERMMTCLTVTPESAAEAISQQADLIISHHPIPFRPLKRITTETVASKLIWDLIRAGVSIYSPHTGFDSAVSGINQSLSQRLGIVDATPIKPILDDPEQLGSGRIGKLSSARSLGDFIDQIKADFELQTVRAVGTTEHSVDKVAVACGSGGSFLSAAIRAGCDTFVTGEATFHTALEAKANGVAMVLLSHHSSERFAVESLATTLASEFSDTTVWASKEESDPIAWF